MPETTLTDERVTLAVDGRLHEGWEEVAITRSLEQIAGTFELGLTERWPDQTMHRAVRRPVAAGAACRLSLGDEVVITGWIDDARPSVTASSHSIAVSGRDATGDLVDCSAVNSPGEWKDQNLTQICAALCKPFAIPVAADADVGKVFASFGIDEGETVFEAISRACRMRAVLPVSDGHGGLLLSRVSPSRAPTTVLRTGKAGNVLSATGGTSLRDRFSRITVKGQAQGDDFTDPNDTASASGEATDPNVTRYRPLIVIAEDQGDGAGFRDRAVWETSVRRARARSAEITVQGWRRDDARLWAPLDVVRLEIPELGPPETVLVSSVTLQKNASGTIARLTLSPPGAFELVAIKGDEDEAASW